MKKYTVVFSEQEMQELIHLIDIAVKSSGLRVAIPAAKIDTILGDAIRQQNGESNEHTN